MLVATDGMCVVNNLACSVLDVPHCLVSHFSCVAVVGGCYGAPGRYEFVQADSGNVIKAALVQVMDAGLWYGNFDIIFGPFLTHSQLPPPPCCPCAVVSVLSMLIWELLWAWNPMLCPCWRFRYAAKIKRVDLEGPRGSRIEIHFEGWAKTFDKWMYLSQNMVRRLITE